MSCQKCSTSKTPFCGSCGSRITSFISCPWCNATNAAEDSYCCSCGRKIAYEPFTYTKNATTYGKMLREVLKANTAYNEDQIERFISKMERNNDYKCPICGEIHDVASVKQRELLGHLQGFGVTFVEAIFQHLEEPNVGHDGVEEFIGQDYMKACLKCGHVWL